MTSNEIQPVSLTEIFDTMSKESLEIANDPTHQKGSGVNTLITPKDLLA